VAFFVLVRWLFWWLLGLRRLRNILWTPDFADARLLGDWTPYPTRRSGIKVTPEVFEGVIKEVKNRKRGLALEILEEHEKG
jgi:hypothetical protein